MPGKREQVLGPVSSPHGGLLPRLGLRSDNRDDLDAMRYARRVSGDLAPAHPCKRRSQESWTRAGGRGTSPGSSRGRRAVITGSPASKTVPGCGMSPRRGTANGGGESAGSQSSRSGRRHRADANRIILPTTRLPGGPRRSRSPSPALRAPSPGERVTRILGFARPAMLGQERAAERQLEHLDRGRVPGLISTGQGWPSLRMKSTPNRPTRRKEAARTSPRRPIRADSRSETGHGPRLPR